MLRSVYRLAQCKRGQCMMLAAGASCSESGRDVERVRMTAVQSGLDKWAEARDP